MPANYFQVIQQSHTCTHTYTHGVRDHISMLRTVDSRRGHTKYFVCVNAILTVIMKNEETECTLPPCHRKGNKLYLAVLIFTRIHTGLKCNCSL